MSHSRESGVVLLLALMVMALTMSIGLAYLQSSTRYLESQEVAWDRLQARGSAESALLIGLARIEGDPTFRGEIAVDGFGRVDITTTAGGAFITATGTTGTTTTTTQSCQAYVTIEETHAWSAPMLVGGSISVDPLFAVEDPGVEVLGAPVSVDVSGSRLGLVEGAASLVGDLFAADKLQIKGSESVEGVLVVDGDVDFNGQRGDVTLQHGADSYDVLLTSGDLHMFNIGVLTINGIVVVEGDVHLNNISAVTGRGVLVCNGRLQINNVDAGSWSIDPDMMSATSSRVFGRESSVNVAEEWRRLLPATD